MKLIVNIPAYNEEKKISETIQRIKKSFGAAFYVSGAGKIITEKLIQLVDDGSSDKTVEKAREAGVDIVISYKPNRRLAYAFKRAAESALENSADLFVNIDADGQFDPEDIPKLLSPILAGKSDMVIANRFGDEESKNIPWIKDFLNRFASSITGFFLGYHISDLTCGFRAHSREALLRLNLTNVHFTYTQETIIDAIGKNLKLEWVPVKTIYFSDRKSKIVRSVRGFVSNSAKVMLKAIRDVRPMKFFGWPGLFFMAVGILGFIDFLYRYLQTFKISPYLHTITFSSIALFLGIQLLIFAFIADMIKSSRQLTEELMYQWKKDKYGKE
ncbi:MAG: glycosyltransferase family 2 protein [Candidatus Pacebacteria bacterium]|nr:glycosyltransferase family 2 protein [Candidatus Paceibacterota bacterium]MDR3582777.1 glycosyltransferase family 2 protein [Candidatus Paceibacterota bacterium]